MTKVDKIALLSGLSDTQAEGLSIPTEGESFANALGVNPEQLLAFDLIRILQEGHLPPEVLTCDAAIVGGSPETIHGFDVSVLGDLLRSEKVQKILAVCFGFQGLMAALGGTLGKAAPPEYGSKTVTWVGSHPTLHHVPGGGQFSTIHSDAVSSLPSGIVALTNEDDPSGIQAAAGVIQGVKILGTQFHPEMLPETVWALERHCPAGASRTEIVGGIYGANLVRGFMEW